MRIEPPTRRRANPSNPLAAIALLLLALVFAGGIFALTGLLSPTDVSPRTFATPTGPLIAETNEEFGRPAQPQASPSVVVPSVGSPPDPTAQATAAPTARRTARPTVRPVQSTPRPTARVTPRPPAATPKPPASTPKPPPPTARPTPTHRPSPTPTRKPPPTPRPTEPPTPAPPTPEPTPSPGGGSMPAGADLLGPGSAVIVVFVLGLLVRSKGREGTGPPPSV